VVITLWRGLVSAAKMASDGAVLFIVVVVAIVIGFSGMTRPNYGYGSETAPLPANPNEKNG
jgi:hypothetical protein